MPPETPSEVKENLVLKVGVPQSSPPTSSHQGTASDQIQSELDQRQEEHESNTGQSRLREKRRAKSNEPSEADVFGSINNLELDKLVEVSEKPQVAPRAVKAPGRLQRPVGRLEIPETPPVCSSDPSLVMSGPRTGNMNDGRVVEEFDINGGNSTGKLCSTCKKQRVLAKGATW
jgi:hypothetical protein